jgi:hypothetical protein
MSSISCRQYAVSTRALQTSHWRGRLYHQQKGSSDILRHSPILLAVAEIVTTGVSDVVSQGWPAILALRIQSGPAASVLGIVC